MGSCRARGLVKALLYDVLLLMITAAVFTHILMITPIFLCVMIIPAMELLSVT